MYPFYNTNTNNLFPLPIIPFGVRRRGNIPTLDKDGIFEVCTTGLLETAGETVDYGINPCVWNRLPSQCIILWKVKHLASTTGAALPATVVVPTSGASTVSSSGSASSAGNTKVPVVDNKHNQVTGSDITDESITEHLVYIDKCSGIFKLLGVLAAGEAAPAA